MENSEIQILLWKMVAIISFLTSLLAILFCLLLYKTRFKMGRLSGALEMLDKTSHQKTFHEKHKLYTQFCKMLDQELGSGDLCDEIKGEALTQIRQ